MDIETYKEKIEELTRVSTRAVLDAAKDFAEETSGLSINDTLKNLEQRVTAGADPRTGLADKIRPVFASWSREELEFYASLCAVLVASQQIGPKVKELCKETIVNMGGRG